MLLNYRYFKLTLGTESHAAECLSTSYSSQLSTSSKSVGQSNTGIGVVKGWLKVWWQSFCYQPFAIAAR
jgi:hypothetical protein